MFIQYNICNRNSQFVPLGFCHPPRHNPGKLKLPVNKLLDTAQKKANRAMKPVRLNV